MLVNPNARRGSEAQEVRPLLEGLGLELVVEEFGDSGEAGDDLKRHAPDVDLAIVCGGDGTVACVGLAAHKAGLPLGILPLGTANDLARTLDLPMDLEAACRVIAAGRTRRIDLGLVNDHPFFNVASLGLSAALADSLDGDAKQRWGRLAYAIEATKVLAATRAFDAEIESAAGVSQVRSLQIAIGNGRLYGGGQVVSQDARIDDGRLDLYSLAPAAMGKLALMFWAFRHGRHGAWREVTTDRAAEFWVRTPTPMPVNTDGDIVTETPAHFVVVPGAVEVIVP
jgi:YegS/Rv2252/BmrU family lipid kinase